MVVPAAGDLASRSLPHLSPLAAPPAPAPVATAPPPPAASPPAQPAVSSQQDALFAFLAAATTPNAPAPVPPKPVEYQQPGVLPFGGAAAQPAAANPYASPAVAGFFGQPQAGERPGLPWENKPFGVGVWWETAQLCLSDAERAFRQMRQSGGIGSPMLYAIFGMLLGFVGRTAWGVPAMMLDVLVGGAGANPGGGQVAGMDIMTSVILEGLFVLFWATGGLLISSAVTHLCLAMVGGAQQGYETTYRVSAFTAGSIAWLNVVPCFGPLIVLGMTLVCQIQGLAQAHETSLGKAAAAVLLPIALCFVLSAGVVLLVIVILVSR
jgi:hypothetical protein